MIDKWGISPLLFILALISSSNSVSEPIHNDIHLTTNSQGYVTGIQGFAVQLKCVLNTCASNVNWFKDDLPIFNGTQFNKTSSFKEDSFILEHKIEVDHSKECTGKCSDVDSSLCPSGTSCIDNVCCPCNNEHYSLVLRNLTFEDAGRYRCQLGNQSELLEFQVEVLESGLRGGFHENISYDHSQCCEEKGISPLCKAMCKPSDMAKHNFDPTSCKTDDYKSFLSCATEGGTRSHVHCCKTQLVPSFCYDLCSADFQMLRRSHRLCLYYLPEIFDCYNRAYLPFPDPPQDVVVNAVEWDKLQVCWKPPMPQKSNLDYPVIDYTVYYKQIPSIPFIGGEDGIPMLSGDYGEMGEDTDYVQNPSVDKRSTREVTQEEFLQSTGIRMFEREESEDSSSTGERRKRQTWVFVTRDDTTNSSAVREFTFSSINTTQECATVKDLRSAARYIVYVTARNGYGTSVPSVRSITSTNVHAITSNTSIPDAMKCCTENGVTSYCSSKMCQVDTDPSTFSVISIATTCRNEWPKVSPCIADGRNHTECCKRKGVQDDCLNICSGASDTLGIHSVLCLNLDLAAIYQCLREGYETHPSPPVNVTVRATTERSAEIIWDEPMANAHLVQSYTLFIRKNEHGAQIRKVMNAVSPHSENDLDPDSSYAVSIQSHSEKGVSLPSTTVLFQTRPHIQRVCTEGDPLYMNNGKPFLCGDVSRSCPVGYTCIGTDNEDEAFCCPKPTSPFSFDSCCKKMEMSQDCLIHCNHNATSFPSSCSPHINSWVRCASDGHDHSRCCEEEEVSHECLSACRHPFEVPESCVNSSTKLARCFSQHHSLLPISPRNLRIGQLDANSVTLKWDHSPSVDTYEIQLFMASTTVNRTNTTTTSIHYDTLNAATEYTARVIAFNVAGSSPPSFNITFSTLPLKDDEGDRPKQPRGLSIAWNKGSSVNVTWDEVKLRRNGEDVHPPIIYTLYFVDAEIQGQWQTIRTNTTWAVMGELRTDALYSIYVTVSEGDNGPSSRSSSVITLIAEPDSFELPEPEIVIEPERSNGVYSMHEKLKINCSVDSSELSDGKLNIDLTIGDEIHANEPGESFVSFEEEANDKMDTMTCSVTSPDGRQNVALKHLLIKFGPSVSMEREKVRQFDDLSSELTCIVEGFPVPDVHFEYQGKRVEGEVRVRTRGRNKYAHTLIVHNVTGRAGWYNCVAERDGIENTAKAELIVSTGLLPVSPRLVLDCCEKEGVQGECLDACTIGEIKSHTNCSQYSTALLKCAVDNRDHGDCCSSKGVSSRCVPLCSGDSFSPDLDCSQYAVTIMSCFIRGHESAPSTPRSIQYEITKDNKVNITWNTSTASDSNVYYAIYYKRYKDDNEDYKLVKTLNSWMQLELPGEDVFDIAVIAANAYGHSPLSFLQIDKRQSVQPSSSSFWPIFLFALLLIFIVAAFVLYSRRGSSFIPPILMRNRRVPHNDPTVAFENPGYGNDLGDEVEIRGLGSVGATEWQNTQLNATSTSTNDNNAMRYSKLH